MIYSDK